MIRKVNKKLRGRKCTEKWRKKLFFRNWFYLIFRKSLFSRLDWSGLIDFLIFFLRFANFERKIFTSTHKNSIIDLRKNQGVYISEITFLQKNSKNKIILRIFQFLSLLKIGSHNIRKICLLHDCKHVYVNRLFQYSCSEAPAATKNEENWMKNDQESAPLRK